AMTKALSDGQAALAAGDFDKATAAYQQANTLAPGNVDALAGLSRAEQAKRDRLTAERKRQADGKAKTDSDAKARMDAEAKRLADAKVKADADARAKADA